MIRIYGVAHVQKPKREAPAARMFLVRRDMPGPRSLSAENVLLAARQSRSTAAQEIHWVDGIATEDRVLLLYTAPNEETVRRHAELSGLTAAEIVEVKQRIGEDAAYAAA